MDIRIHEISQRFVDHAMTFQGVQARETVRCDPDAEVSFAFLGARVSSVFVAVVDDLEYFRGECRL